MELDVDDIRDLAAVGAERDADPTGVVRADGNAAVVRAVPCFGKRAGLLLCQVIANAVIGRSHGRAAIVDPQVEPQIVTQALRVHPEPEHLAAGPVGVSTLVGRQIQGEYVRAAVSAVLAEGQRTAALHAAAGRAKHTDVARNVAVPAEALRPVGSQQIIRDIFHIPRGLVRGGKLRALVAQPRAHGAGILGRDAEVIKINRTAQLGLAVIGNVQIDRLDLTDALTECLQRHADPADIVHLQRDTAIARTGVSLGRGTALLGDVLVLRHGEEGITHAHARAVQLQLHGHRRADLARVVPDPEHFAARPVERRRIVLFQTDGINVRPVIRAVLAHRKRAAALIALAVDTEDTDVVLDKGIMACPVGRGPLCLDQIIGDVFHIPDDSVLREGAIVRERCDHAGIVRTERTTGLIRIARVVVGLSPIAADNTAEYKANHQRQTDHAFQ